MGRDLTIYPSRITEKQMLSGERTLICFTRLACERAGGDFLAQCGAYGDYFEDDENKGLKRVLSPRTVPDHLGILIVEEDDEDWSTNSDGTRVQYCTAKEFDAINPEWCDGAPDNIAALAYIKALPPETVIVLRIH